MEAGGVIGSLVCIYAHRNSIKNRLNVAFLGKHLSICMLYPVYVLN